MNYRLIKSNFFFSNISRQIPYKIRLLQSYQNGLLLSANHIEQENKRKYYLKSSLEIQLNNKFRQLIKIILHLLYLNYTRFLFFQLLKVYPKSKISHNRSSLTTKLAVRSKQIIKTNYDETQLLEPIEIKKNKVQEILKGYPEDYRVLIRPSGTEDVVRVLSEGPNEVDVVKLNTEIIELLKQYMEID